MKAFRIGYLVIALVLGGALHVQAATYYADVDHPSASDSNPGTEALPWATLYKAASTMVAGDTTLVKDGTYTATGGNFPTPAINPTNSGTSGNPIVFKAFPGHAPILDNEATGAHPAIGSHGKDYITIDGFTITGMGNFGIMVFGTSSGDRLDGVIVENNTISALFTPSGDNTDAIRIENTSNCIIRNNRIFDVSNAAFNGNDAGVKIYTTDNLIIENNEISDVGTGIHEKVAGSSNTFRYNFVYDFRNWGIGTQGGVGTTQNTKIYNNITTDGDLSVAISIRVQGEGANPNLNAQVYNNSMSNARYGVFVSSDATNVQVWNNIIYGTGSIGNITDTNPQIGYADYQSFFLAPTEGGANSITANPNFVDIAFTDVDDFKLQAGSPALDAGRFGEHIGAYATGTEIIGLGASPEVPSTLKFNLQLNTRTGG